jgi:hypothetical protein
VLWSASAVVVLCLVAGLLYFTAAARVSRGKRILLTGLRLAALAVLCVGVMRLSLVIDQTSLPSLAILIDRSGSMARQDVETFGEQSRHVSRLGAVQGWLSRSPENPLESLGQSYRLRLFSFAGNVQPIASDQQPEELITTVLSLRPDGRETRLASALQAVLEDFRGAPPAAVIVFSDGLASEGPTERLSVAAEAARSAAVPVWAIGVGSASSGVDLAITEVLADEIALLGDTVTFDARVEATGISSRNVEVRLTDPQGEVLDTALAAIDASGSARAALSWQPTAEGRQRAIVQVLPLPDELDIENNLQSVSVQVRSRKLKVLYVERQPRWEFRHLKAALERDESIELRTVLLQSDLDYTREDRTALAQPPASETELFDYDAVILGDVEPGLLPTGFLDLVGRHVSENGAGAILIAGERFNPSAYRQSPLEDVSPVIADRTSATRSDGVAPVITSAGQRHALFRLEADPAADEQLSLPELHWSAEVSNLKAGAEVLAELTPAGGAASVPVVVVQRFGGGQVLWHGTDELWKWRRLREDALYGRYWSQAVRWVSRARLAGNSTAGELRTDRRVYSPGDPIRILLSVREEDALPPDFRPQLELERASGERRSLTMGPDGDARRFSAVVTAVGQGVNRIRWVNSPAAGVSEWEFRIDSSGNETQAAAIDREDLARASQLTRGRYLEWGEVEKLRQELPTGRPVISSRATTIPLWNRWEAAALFCGLVCVEWFVRRRSRLV